MNELVSRSTRGMFRDLITSSTLGAIGAAFQDEGFAPNPVAPGATWRRRESHV